MPIVNATLDLDQERLYIKGICTYIWAYAQYLVTAYLSTKEVLMTSSAPGNNVRRHGPSDAKAVDPTLYKWGWLMGLAFGALTAAYRYAG